VEEASEFRRNELNAGLAGTRWGNGRHSELARKMGVVAQESVRFFGHESEFDFRGASMACDNGGFGYNAEVPTNEEEACLAVCIYLGITNDPDVIRQHLINMRAFAIARDLAEREVEPGELALSLGRTQLRNAAASHISEATALVDNEQDLVEAVLKTCKLITEQTQEQMREWGKLPKNSLL